MPPKKKILHLIQSLSSGGCENMLLRTLPLLNNFEHKIIALKELGELAPKFVSSNITVETIHCNGLFDISGILRLRRAVKEENPDIILTYLFHADLLGRLFLQLPSLSLRSRQGGKSNLNSHSKKVPIIPFLRTTYNHPKYLIARVLEWLTKPLVSRYLANSVAVKNFFVNNIGVQPEKITVIQNGINIEYFDSITPDPELKKSLSIKPDDFVIICVANLHINKGHCYLLKAFEQLHSLPSPPFQGGELKRGSKLIIVGDGEERENLKKQAKNYSSKDNILFLGKRTDVPQLLKISNLFILPTLFEGQSNAIMEAMNSGIPVITTDIPENKELIENNQTGILISIKNSEVIYKAIKTLLENPESARKLSENAKLFIKDNFSLKKIVDEWVVFLNNN